MTRILRKRLLALPHWRLIMKELLAQLVKLFHKYKDTPTITTPKIGQRDVIATHTHISFMTLTHTQSAASLKKISVGQ